MQKNKPIYVTEPFLPDLVDFIPMLESIWESKWITNSGIFHQTLESELAKYLKVPYVSLFSNGTLALLIAIKHLNLSGEVITTPFSFVATTHCLWWNNIEPVFVDIEPDHFNLDPSKIERAITSKTTAILPVHVYGNACNVNQINKIANKHGLKVIYDAAHAFGVKNHNKSLLNFGDLSILSFHATKVYHTFEGGAIICKDRKSKENIDNLKNFGIIDETTIAGLGINAKMNEFQSAFGLLQLKHIDALIEKRKNIYNTYIEELKNVAGISTNKEQPGISLNYSYFPILVDDQEYGLTRNELYSKLKKNKIFARRYFYPLISNFGIYNHLPSATQNNLPVANNIADRVLCLPIYPNLTKENQYKCIKIIKNKHK